MLKLKIGDKAVVRNDLYSGMNIRCGFNRDMETLRGKVVTIKSSYDYGDGTDKKVYHIKEDKGNWNWSDEMFEDTDDLFDSEIICPKCHKPYLFDKNERVEIYLGKMIVCKSCKNEV